MIGLNGFLERFRAKVVEAIELEPGDGFYRIHTPATFDDGDCYVIVLHETDAGWLLSDEGHTLMHLSYRLDDDQLLQGSRAEIISRVCSMFDITNDKGVLSMRVTNDDCGDALWAFMEALTKISDVEYLSRERVQSTFLNDFRDALTKVVPPARCSFGWHDPERDPTAKYVVDCRVNAGQTPLFVYALDSDSKTRDATISLLQFEKWRVRHEALGVFEDRSRIGRKVAERFLDVCQFVVPDLNEGHRQNLEEFVGRRVAS